MTLQGYKTSALISLDIKAPILTRCYSYFTTIKQQNLERLSGSDALHQPILVQCHISIPPENFRKPKVF